MMKKFIIDSDDFGVGKVTYNIDWENKIIKELVIFADEKTFENLSDDERGNWNWALYPPKLYFIEIPFELNSNKIIIPITDEILDDYDVALYFMSHNDIEGEFSIDPNEVFMFTGYTYILNKRLSLEVELNLKPY